jgi:DNA repair exonuclease SbcCD ATPase subunit
MRRVAILVFAGVLCLILPLAAGASQHESGKAERAKVEKEVSEALQAIRNYGVERRDEAVRKAREALDDLDARIQKLEDRFDAEQEEMKASARKEARSAMKTLREKRRKVAEWYGGLEHSSKEAWDHAKKGFLESYDSLRRAFDKAAGEF